MVFSHGLREFTHPNYRLVDSPRSSTIELGLRTCPSAPLHRRGVTEPYLLFGWAQSNRF
jgi:hypothetical protein